MFTRKIKLFRLFGFEVSIDGSWIFLAFLVVWTLATGYFPHYVKELSVGSYWMMAWAGTAGLFLSMILHEMCHSLVARKYGLPMKGITLFLFGGIAEMGEEPRNAKTEFLMSIAGPVCSFFVSFLFFGVHRVGTQAGWPIPSLGVVHYLSHINLVLALFNLIPAFPLDGGRILRSILWAVKKDVRWATRISSRIGSGFGVALLAIAFLNLFYGNLVRAIWLGLIGLFLKGLSQVSYQQVIVREALAGEPVRQFMKDQVISVPPSLTLEDLVQDYIYKFHHKMFPVMDGTELLGCVGTKQLKETPREAWNRKKISEVVQPCSPDNVIGPEDDAAKAISQMSRTGNSRLLIIDRGDLVGILTLKDMLEFLSLKLDLEGELEERGPRAIQRRIQASGPL